jgi:hypothetical protein
MAIPWPDSIAVFVSATIHGNDERGRLMRRTILRYKYHKKEMQVYVLMYDIIFFSKLWNERSIAVLKY